MENSSNISLATQMTRGIMTLVIALSASFANPLEGIAQQEDENVAYFKSLIPERDTVSRAKIDSVRKNTFWKRLSLHTNMIDWATLVPNVGLEVDLDQNKKNPSGNDRTHYSIMFTGKYNGMPKFGKFIYGVGSARIEGRKYWRTGKRGVSVVHGDYRKLHINKKDTARYNGDPNRSFGYNLYNKVRRNITSSRTINDARNWRAYYVGLWFSYDKFDIAAAGNRKRGTGLTGGLSFGYDIPLLPQRFPKEGSLDLELGINVGVKGVNCTSYTWVVDETTGDGEYGNATASGSYKIVPYPVIQDLHASLVWRLRSINNKVDRSLIDDYENKIRAFQDRRQAKMDSILATNVRNYEKKIKDSTYQAFHADSLKYTDYYNLRRLKNAMLLNPDTTFTGQDYNLYLKLVKGIDPTPANLKKLAKEKAEQEKLKAAEEAKKASEIKKAEAVAAKQKAADDKKKAIAEKKKSADELKKTAGKKKAKDVSDTQQADESSEIVKNNTKQKSDKVSKKAKKESEKAAIISQIKEENKVNDEKAKALKEAKAKEKAKAKAEKNVSKESSDSNIKAKEAAAKAKEEAAAKSKAEKEAAAKAKEEAAAKAKAEKEAAAKAKEEAAAKAKAEKEAAAKAKEEAAAKAKAEKEAAAKAKEEAAAKAKAEKEAAAKAKTEKKEEKK